MLSNSSKPFRKIEIGGNIAIVAVAFLLLVILVKRHFISSTTSNGTSSARSNKIHVGSKFSLPDIDWSQYGQTLAVVMSEGCNHCVESVPFYRRLSQALSVQKTARFLALFSNASADAYKYLKDTGVKADSLMLAPLAELGISLLPSIYLVDEGGTITDAWVGKLSSEGESKLLGRLSISTDSSGPSVNLEKPNGLDSIPSITANVRAVIFMARISIASGAKAVSSRRLTSSRPITPARANARW